MKVGFSEGNGRKKTKEKTSGGEKKKNYLNGRVTRRGREKIVQEKVKNKKKSLKGSHGEKFFCKSQCQVQHFVV